MTKETIVDRLSKIFPNTVIYHEGEFARDSNESDPDYTFIPPHEGELEGIHKDIK